MSDQKDETLVEYRLKMYRVVIPIFVVVCMIAFVLNTFVIWALKRTKIWYTGLVLILSLTISDIFTSVIVGCSLLYNSYLPQVQNTSVNPCISLTLENLRSSGLLTGFIHLLLISFNQYISIVKPHINKELLLKIAVVLCAAAWILPLSVLVSLSFSFKEQGYYDCMRVDFYHSFTFRAITSGFLLLIFIAIVLCYAEILCILKKQTIKLNSRLTHKRVFRILWTAIFICSTTFIGWFPAIAVFLLTCSSCELLRQQKFRTIFIISCTQLSFMLAKSLLNPIIYSLRIPEVDLEVRALFSMCGKNINRIFISKSTSRERISGENSGPKERLLGNASENIALNVKRSRSTPRNTL